MNIALEQTEEYANGQVRITVRDQLDDSKKVVFQGCRYIFSCWHFTLCGEISTQPQTLTCSLACYLLSLYFSNVRGFIKVVSWKSVTFHRWANMFGCVLFITKSTLINVLMVDG